MSDVLQICPDKGSKIGGDSMTVWDEQQAQAGVPLVERTYKVIKPNGEVTEVNRFDFNLAYCVARDRYIQCMDTSWIRVRNLMVLEG